MESDRRVAWIHEAIGLRRLSSNPSLQRVFTGAFHTVFEALPAQAVVLAPDGTIVAANRSWREFAATSSLSDREYGLGENYLACCEQAIGVGSEEAVRAAAGIRDVLNQQKKSFSAEYPIQSDETERWFRLIIVPLPAPSLAAVAMHVDVTKRKLAEQQLREADARYRLLVETSHDLIWAVDELGRFTYLNPTAEKIYGRKVSEMIGKAFVEFTTPQEHEKDRDVFQRAVPHATESLNYESQTHRQDGSTIVLHSNARIFRDELGRFTGSAGSSRDITETKRAQEALRASETSLATAQRVGR